MLDRATFLRPIAHRGLHDHAQGRIENSRPAFEAAIARGFGIECDLRPAACGTPMVFHDAELDRLVEASGFIADHPAAQLERLTYRGSDSRIMSFAALCDLVDGRVPIFAEVKSKWAGPELEFLQATGVVSQQYRGPLAFMSFDPVAMATLRTIAPGLPLGVAAGLTNHPPWPDGSVDTARAQALADLLESRAAAPDFYAYHVKDLPTPVTRYAREVAGIPLLAWTVRTAEDKARAARWADAPIFEEVAAP